MKNPQAVSGFKIRFRSISTSPRLTFQPAPSCLPKLEPISPPIKNSSSAASSMQRAKNFILRGPRPSYTQWFTPPPWKTLAPLVDVRPGGANCVTMQSPDGQEFPNRGIYLEIVPDERLVWTDAFTVAWEPSEKPFTFITCILTFEDAGNGKTLYTARVRHWTVADREAHEKISFNEGWGIVTNQFEAMAQKL